MNPALLLPLAFVAAPATKTPAAPTAVETPRPSERTIVGQILSVDLEKRVIVVGESLQSSNPKTSPRTREPLSLIVDSSTRVFRGLKPGALEDLKPKDHAVVHYVMTTTGARAVSCRVAEVARPDPTASGAPGNSTAQ